LTAVDITHEERVVDRSVLDAIPPRWQGLSCHWVVRGVK
jgi:hypothetical protein